MTSTTFIERQRNIRRDVLRALYHSRRCGEEIHLSGMLLDMGHEMRECRFALDYLVEAQCIHSDGFKSRITAKGIERYEEDLR